VGRETRTPESRFRAVATGIEGHYKREWSSGICALADIRHSLEDNRFVVAVSYYDQNGDELHSLPASPANEPRLGTPSDRNESLQRMQSIIRHAASAELSALQLATLEVKPKVASMLLFCRQTLGERIANQETLTTRDEEREAIFSLIRWAETYALDRPTELSKS
jgi:hypothetical protein